MDHRPNHDQSNKGGIRPEVLPNEGRYQHFGWARGSHVCKCTICNHYHLDADKQATSCQPCAVKAWEKEAQMSDAQRYIERLQHVWKETQTVLLWNEHFIAALLKNGLRLSTVQTRDYQVMAPLHHQTDSSALSWPAGTYIVEV